MSLREPREVSMSGLARDIDSALNDVSASSAGGSPFLFSYGLTFCATAMLSLLLPIQTVAVMAMFQGAVALPLAFWLERRLGLKRMAADNPLRSLSGQMAVSQALGLPALIATYSLDPDLVPLVLASLGGVHFLPYAWLQRNRVYVYLAVAVSVGAYVIQVILPARESTVILLYVALLYWAGAILVYRKAARLVTASYTRGL
jgi:hypothetical protein